MSNFKDSPHFATHDDYYTPISAWKQIKPFIDKKGYNKIFECFLLNSNEQSKRNLETLGYEVIGDKTVDFLDKSTWSEEMLNKDYGLILSNPPFERIKSYKQRTENLKYKCIKQLVDNDKPFIILMNSTNMFQKWFKEIVENKDVKFIFPSKKINYDKYDKGGVEKVKTQNIYLKELKKKKKDLTKTEKEIYAELPSLASCSFNSIYVCYKVLDKNEWI